MVLGPHSLIDSLVDPAAGVIKCSYRCHTMVLTYELCEQVSGNPREPPPECPRCVRSVFLQTAVPAMPAVKNLTDAAGHSEMELAFDVEPVVGWRAYKIVRFLRRGGPPEWRLASLTGREVYPAREPTEARCLPDGGGYGYTPRTGFHHEAPWPGCVCGIWATRTKELMVGEAERYADAWGEVKLWGRVLEFAKGWRAQYAYPKNLTIVRLPPIRVDDGPLPDALQAAYGVPVELDQSWSRETLATGEFIKAAHLATGKMLDFQEAMAALGLLMRQTAPAGKRPLPPSFGFQVEPQPPQLAWASCPNKHKHPAHVWKQGRGVTAHCPGIQRRR